MKTIFKKTISITFLTVATLFSLQAAAKTYTINTTAPAGYTDGFTLSGNYLSHTKKGVLYMTAVADSGYSRSKIGYLGVTTSKADIANLFSQASIAGGAAISVFVECKSATLAYFGNSPADDTITAMGPCAIMTYNDGAPVVPPPAPPVVVAPPVVTPPVVHPPVVDPPPTPAPVVYNELTDTRVFNAAWYLSVYPDLQKAFGSNTAAATAHWLQYGIGEGRQGIASFSSQLYVDKYSDLMAAFETDHAAAIKHFIEHGISEGRTAYPPPILGGGSTYNELTDPKVFNVIWYLIAYPDLKAAFGNDYAGATQHWLNNGIAEGRQGNATFNAQYYVDQYPDLRDAFQGDHASAILHYLRHGITEKRSGTPPAIFCGPLAYNELLDPKVFDFFYYIGNNNSEAKAYTFNCQGAIQDWLNSGIQEGLRGSKGFSAVDYVERYQDLQNAFGTNRAAAIQHYLRYGIHEGRSGQ